MRIAVIGSGGIGGYYGALLAKAGHDVVFVARGAHLEAMQRHGLTIRTSGGETTVPVIAVADTGRVEPVELVLFCVKSYDTESAAPLLRPLMGRDTTVLTFQNGVDNADTIGSVVGSHAVLPGAVYVALQLAGPGVVLRTGGEGRMAFGELNGVVSERIQRIAGAFRQSGIPHEVSPDIQRLRWEKFLFITGVGGVTALARAGIGPVLASPEGRTLLTASCDEIVAVAQAAGAPLSPAAARAAIEEAATVPPSGDRRWHATSKMAAGSRSKR